MPSSAARRACTSAGRAASRAGGARRVERRLLGVERLAGAARASWSPAARPFGFATGRFFAGLAVPSSPSSWGQDTPSPREGPFVSRSRPAGVRERSPPALAATVAPLDRISRRPATAAVSASEPAVADQHQARHRHTDLPGDVASPRDQTQPAGVSPPTTNRSAGAPIRNMIRLFLVDSPGLVVSTARAAARDRAALGNRRMRWCRGCNRRVTEKHLERGQPRARSPRPCRGPSDRHAGPSPAIASRARPGRRQPRSARSRLLRSPGRGAMRLSRPACRRDRATAAPRRRRAPLGGGAGLDTAMVLRDARGRGSRSSCRPPPGLAASRASTR
jgi:hypothetical protein